MKKAFWLMVLMTSPAMADNCPDPRDLQAMLPPVEFQVEPSKPFYYTSKEQLLSVISGPLRPGQIVYGWSNPNGEIFICMGMSPTATRIIRMHEEAHLKGWRH